MARRKRKANRRNSKGPADDSNILRRAGDRNYPAEKALLSLNLNETQTETAASYDLDRSIRLINPLLELVNTQSSELDKKYSQHRLSDLELPFLDKQIRND